MTWFLALLKEVYLGMVQLDKYVDRNMYTTYAYGVNSEPMYYKPKPKIYESKYKIWEPKSRICNHQSSL